MVTSTARLVRSWGARSAQAQASSPRARTRSDRPRAGESRSGPFLKAVESRTYSRPKGGPGMVRCASSPTSPLLIVSLVSACLIACRKEPLSSFDHHRFYSIPATENPALPLHARNHGWPDCRGELVVGNSYGVRPERVSGRMLMLTAENAPGCTMMELDLICRDGTENHNLVFRVPHPAKLADVIEVAAHFTCDSGDGEMSVTGQLEFTEITDRPGCFLIKPTLVGTLTLTGTEYSYTGWFEGSR